MADAGLSVRALAAETRRHDPTGSGLTHGHLGQLAGGHEHPSQRALQLLAATFDRTPSTSLNTASPCCVTRSNERQVGYEEALRTMQRFDQSRLVA